MTVKAQINLYPLYPGTARSNLPLAGYGTKLAIKILISDMERGCRIHISVMTSRAVSDSTTIVQS